MVELRPLIVVTGTVRVGGGEKTKTESDVTGHRVVSTTVRNVSDDRRAANVIATNYIRRLGKVILLRTPFGALVDKARFDELEALVNQASIDISRFNSVKRRCVLTNTLVWERLEKNRLAAVSGWIAANAAEVQKRPGLWDKLVVARAA